jgi:hypothetical protein
LAPERFCLIQNSLCYDLRQKAHREKVNTSALGVAALLDIVEHSIIVGLVFPTTLIRANVIQLANHLVFSRH